jgi:hemerythrin-like domain-containing protein
MSIAHILHQHHVRCDNLFAAAEEACHRADWKATDAALASFVSQTESHFGAEEEILFPAFEQVTGMVSGPTAMMRMEHRQMRTLFEQMRASVTAQDAEGFAGATETLLVLMQQHNMKEENILYPMCEQALPGGEIADSLRSCLPATRT